MRLPIYAIAILASASVSTTCWANCWAKEQSFSKRSARVRVGCEDTRGTQIEYQAPAGWRIIRYDTGWVGVYAVEGHTANVQDNSREKPTSVLATGTITGQTKGYRRSDFGTQVCEVSWRRVWLAAGSRDHRPLTALSGSTDSLRGVHSIRISNKAQLAGRKKYDRYLRP
jgi:hypothetical protein